MSEHINNNQTQTKRTTNYCSNISKSKINCFIHDSTDEIIGEIVVQFDFHLNDSFKESEEIELLVSKLHYTKMENHKKKPNAANVQRVKIKLPEKQKNTSLVKGKSSDISYKTKKNHIHPKIPPIQKTSTKLSLNTIYSSTLLSYLTGQSLLPSEELLALESLRSASPTESLMDTLSDLDCLQNFQKEQNERINFNRINLSKNCAIRLSVYELRLLKAGVREITVKNNCQTSFSSGSFIIDVKTHDASVNYKSSKNMIFSNHIDAHNSSEYTFVYKISVKTTIILKALFFSTQEFI